MDTTVKVSGMTCKNCEAAVKEALLDLAGVTSVNVNLDTGDVTIAHSEDVNEATLKQVIEDQGYDVA